MALPHVVTGLIEKRVGSCLRHHRKSGLLTSSKTIGGLIGWEIAK